jgi:arsenate reductase
MQPTLYHNPACGTSRNVLAYLQEHGYQPTVIEYLKTPPSRDEILAIAKKTGQPLRALLREKGTPYADLGLDNPSLTDDDLLNAIDQHPILLNRPIVVMGDRARLCRPSETVLEFLE